MSLGALTFRIFANRFWAHLPREVQIMISRGHAVVYETTLSRLFIPPYIWFQFGSFRALRRFRPASGARHYRSFQDFFVRRLAEEVRPDGEFVWPCDGLLCESAPVTREFVVEVKGEARHVSAVFGPEFAIPEGSHFTNVFLHNSDYHRLHAPVAGRITKVVRIPGELRFLRPWIYRQSPSVPALTNERVNVAIEDQSGRVWFLSFVGGPGVGTVKMLDGVGVGSVVQPGQEIAQFLMGSTCCMVSPVAPVQKVGATVVMGTSLLARPGFPISGNNTDGDSRF